MRTAQETYEHILQEKPSEAAFLIKKYAREVAEQTLKQAANSLMPSKQITKLIILNTEIKTP